MVAARARLLVPCLFSTLGEGSATTSAPERYVRRFESSPMRATPIPHVISPVINFSHVTVYKMPLPPQDKTASVYYSRGVWRLPRIVGYVLALVALFASSCDTESGGVDGPSPRLTAPGEAAGFRVATDGETAVVGVSSGAVAVYGRTAGGWTRQADLLPQGVGPDDGFGWSVAVEGATIAIAAIREGGTSRTPWAPFTSSSARSMSGAKPLGLRPPTSPALGCSGERSPCPRDRCSFLPGGPVGVGPPRWCRYSAVRRGGGALCRRSSHQERLARSNSARRSPPARERSPSVLLSDPTHRRLQESCTSWKGGRPGGP